MPWLRERASQTEVNRRASDETARALIDAGFFHIVMPKSAGGFGMRHSVLWQVARHIGRGCASSGWILGLMGISPWIVGLFDEDAQREVFGSGNPIVPVMTGGVGRELRVERLSDGYEVTGMWHYGTGIDLCDWAIVMAPVPAADGSSPPDARLFLVPHESVEIDDSSEVAGGVSKLAYADCWTERVRVEIWRGGSFRARVAERGVVVIDNGKAGI